MNAVFETVLCYTIPEVNENHLGFIMNMASVFILSAHNVREMMFANTKADRIALACKFLNSNGYDASLTFKVTGDGADGAEEIFDLTNNPSMFERRYALGWVNRRAVSVGDVVAIKGVFFLCDNVGWVEITPFG